MSYILNDDFNGGTWTDPLGGVHNGSDGVSGHLPSSAIWTVYNEAGAPTFGSNDLEFYTNNTNIIYQDGSSNLIIKVGTKGTDGASGTEWPSGRCDTTAGAYYVQLGQSCEIKVRITPLAGCWPADWFFGVNSAYTSTWTEIDMQESGDPQINQSYVTIWGPGAATGTPMGESGPFSINDGQFHIYRLDYTTNSIKIYIDGNFFYNITPSSENAGGGTWYFNSNGGLIVILNVAVSSNYGTPAAGSLPHISQEIDYVRIWAPAGPDPNTSGGGGGGTLVETVPTPFVHSNTATVTSGSFTPTAGSLLVACAAWGNGNGIGQLSLNISDSSGSGSWKLLADASSNVGAGYARVWCRDAWTGSHTVTITAAPATVIDCCLTVKQFTGAAAASAQPGATATIFDTSVNSLSITPALTGSQVVGAYGNSSGAAVLTANASTTILGQYDGGPAGDIEAAMEAASTSTSGTPVSIGWTNSAAACSFALAEIVAPAANTATGSMALAPMSCSGAASATAPLALTSAVFSWAVSAAGTYAWVCPDGVTSVAVACWGAGGGADNPVGSMGGGGGGGGEHAAELAYAVTPGATYTVIVGAGGAPGSGSGARDGAGTSFGLGGVLAHGGKGGYSTAGGAGGTGSANTVTHPGGTGGAGYATSHVPCGGGGGGGSGGSAGLGRDGSAGQVSAGGTGGVAVTGGGAGGRGGFSTTAGSAGSAPGGGAGGAGESSTAGTGSDGQAVLSAVMTLPAVFGSPDTNWEMLAPAGAFAISVLCTGGGGGGAGCTSTANHSGGGGGGGEFAQEATLAITGGSSYDFAVGAAGTGGAAGNNPGTAGGASSFSGDAATVTAHGGSGGAQGAPGAAGAGGTGSTNATHHNGGAGAAGTGSSGIGGGGGSSGGTGGAGNAGSGANAGNAVTGGGPGFPAGTNAGGSLAGDTYSNIYADAYSGYTGIYQSGYSSPYNGPGGGGGGAGNSGSTACSGGNGFAGQVIVYAIQATNPQTGSLGMAPMAMSGFASNGASGTAGGLGMAPMSMSGTSIVSERPFPQVILKLLVEILVNGTWTDITSYVYQRSNIVVSSRGRADETTSVQPTQLQMTVNNRDGRFSPRNQAGPYYGYIGRNTQVRVSAQASSVYGPSVTDTYGDVYNDFYDTTTIAGYSYRFWGEISAWPQQWDATGTDVYVAVTASGILRRLVQGSAIGSALYRYYTRLTGAAVPAAYWPCEDGTQASAFANIVDAINPMSWSGSPQLASNTDFGGSDAIPVLNGSAWDGLTNSFGTSGDDEYGTPGSYQWTASTSTVDVRVWGAGGGGAPGTVNSGGGGGGSEFAELVSYAVIPGQAYALTVGAGGAGGSGASGSSGGAGQQSNFANVVIANGGGGASGQTAGSGGSGSGAPIHHGGGKGAAGITGHASTANFTRGGNFSWTAPAGVTSVKAQCWGAGGGGQGGDAAGRSGRPGGGGAEFAQEDAIAVTPGTVYQGHVGNGGGGSRSAFFPAGSGGGSNFIGDSVTCQAHGGGGAIADTAGTGGTGSSNTIHHDGGHGGVEGGGGGDAGGGGGAGAGPGGNGDNGGNGSGGVSGAGGNGSKVGGGSGGQGGGPGRDGAGGGSGYGGAGGGGGANASGAGSGGGGQDGRVYLVYSVSGQGGGGGGGGSGGTGAAGNNASGSSGGVAVANGGPGGAGGAASDGAMPLSPPGGGGGGGDGAATTPFFSGANGAAGKVELIYTPSFTPSYENMRFLLSVPSGAGTAATVMASMYTSGSIARVDVGINTTSNALTIAGYNSGNVQQFAHTLNENINTIPQMVSASLKQNGSGLTYTLETILPNATALYATYSGNLSSGSMGSVTEVKVNPSGMLTNTALGQITVQYSYVPLTSVSGAIAGYAGERAGTRFSRLLNEEGYTGILTGSAADTPQMGPQTDQTLLTLIQEVEDVDRGLIYEPRDSFSIAYRTRVDMQDQDVALALDYAAAELAAALQPTEDDQLTRNDITMTRGAGGSAAGSSYRAQLLTGALSVLDPPLGAGRYPLASTTNVYSDSQLASLAQWILDTGTINDLRWPLVTVDLSRAEMQSIFSLATALDIGDYFQLVNPPFWTETGPVKQLAWGFTENLNAYIYTIEINAVPESVWEDPTATSLTW